MKKSQVKPITLCDNDADTHYIHHVSKLSNIYNKRQDKGSIVDQQLLQIKRSQSVANMKKHYDENAHKELTKHNVRLFNHISEIQNRPMSKYASEKNLKNSFASKKSLNSGYVRRQKELIDQENIRISNKMTAIKSSLCRENILKVQNELLNHRSHQMKFKPKRRNNLTLPPIFQKEMKVKLKGLHMRVLSAKSNAEISKLSEGHPNIARTRMYKAGSQLTLIAPSEYYFDNKSNLIRSDLNQSCDNSTTDNVWLLGKYAKATLYIKDKSGEFNKQISETEFYMDKMRFFEAIYEDALDNCGRCVKLVIKVENEEEWQEIYSSVIDLNPRQKSFAEFLEKDSMTWCDTKDLNYNHNETNYENFAKLFIAIK